MMICPGDPGTRSTDQNAWVDNSLEPLGRKKAEGTHDSGVPVIAPDLK